MTLSSSQREALLALDVGRVRLDEPMRKHTSFRIGGPVDAYVEVASVDAIERLFAWCRAEGLPLLSVGGGCNLLVRDGGIRGIVMRLGRPFRRLFVVREGEGADNPESGDEVVADAVSRFDASQQAAEAGAVQVAGPSGSLAEDDGRVLVHVDAGVAVPALLKFCVRRGLSGAEGLAGVPGTVGGSLVMNAGTHEGELCSVVHTMSVVTEAGDLKTYRQEDLSYRYRHLDLPAGEFIVCCVLALTPAPPADIQRAITDLIDYRKSTQPVRIPSAGCVFKNPPVGPPAGKLIDDAGLKGTRVRGALVSDVHANYVVNTGDATARDVIELMARVRDEVERRWGVVLENEVRVVGEASLPQMHVDRT